MSLDTVLAVVFLVVCLTLSVVVASALSHHRGRIIEKRKGWAKVISWRTDRFTLVQQRDLAARPACTHPDAVEVTIATGETVATWCPDCQTQTPDPRWLNPYVDPEPLDAYIEDTKKALLRQDQRLSDLCGRPVYGWLDEQGEVRTPDCDFCDQPMHTALDQRVHLNVCTPERTSPWTP